MHTNQHVGMGDCVNLNQFLIELHAKRDWLNQIIGGLEALEKSPEMTLLNAVDDVLDGEWHGKHKASLDRSSKRRLMRLAGRVKKRSQSTHAKAQAGMNIPA